MKRKSISMVFAGLGLAALCIACNPSQKGEDATDMANDQNEQAFETPEAEADAKFVVDVVEESYAEIKLAQLAMRRSNDPKVKEAAGMLEKDHSKLITELKSLATEKGISIPLEEDNESRASIAALEKKSQDDFDKEWLTTLLDRHRQGISSLEERLQQTQDDELKTWIDETLPKMHVHQDMLTAYRKQQG